MPNDLWENVTPLPSPKKIETLIQKIADAYFKNSLSQEEINQLPLSTLSLIQSPLASIATGNLILEIDPTPVNLMTPPENPSSISIIDGINGVKYHTNIHKILYFAMTLEERLKAAPSKTCEAIEEDLKKGEHSQLYDYMGAIKNSEAEDVCEEADTSSITHSISPAGAAIRPLSAARFCIPPSTGF